MNERDLQVSVAMLEQLILGLKASLLLENEETADWYRGVQFTILCAEQTIKSLKEGTR